MNPLHTPSLAVGIVESVAANEIEVLLDAGAPRAIALNAGVPTSFPRINGYLLIPIEGGSLVGLIVKLWIERSRLSRSTDKELLDLPYPIRKLRLTPLGMLSSVPDTNGVGGYRLDFRRGVTVFPSVGDTTVLPSAPQLRAIVESAPLTRRVSIGRSPLLAATDVAIDPDRLFGGHLAVLGNTGSGKSCSVAGIIRQSIRAASEARTAARIPVNARFLILDPNGEYRTCFANSGARFTVYQVPPANRGASALLVPAWMWNTNEWSAFSAAAPALQRPLLQQSIRALKAGASTPNNPATALRRRLAFVHQVLTERLASGGEQYAIWGPAQTLGQTLAHIIVDIGKYVGAVSQETKQKIVQLTELCESLRDGHAYKHGDSIKYNIFSETELISIRTAVAAVLDQLPTLEAPPHLREDVPLPFDVHTLPDFLEQLASESGANGAAHTAGLVVRIRNMLGDPLLASIVAPANSPSLPAWLGQMLGPVDDGAGEITVIDLSLIPTDTVHLIVAVIARLVFEALQRYSRTFGVELPTILVMEEAHAFISRSNVPETSVTTPADTCRAIFERIAREGRKFGLGLMLSSQRPSELSPTVLSQCNTFLLHRIVNDRDQDLVARLVPDSLGGMLQELPTLPARHALVVGQATPIPLLVEMGELQPEQRPRSENPRFWDTWTGTVPRVVDWPAIASEWQGD